MYRNYSHIVGLGSHGTVVMRGLWSGKVEVALKRMQKLFFTAHENEMKMMLEMERHPNIVHYIDAVCENNSVHAKLGHQKRLESFPGLACFLYRTLHSLGSLNNVLRA